MKKVMRQSDDDSLVEITLYKKEIQTNIVGFSATIEISAKDFKKLQEGDLGEEDLIDQYGADWDCDYEKAGNDDAEYSWEEA